MGEIEENNSFFMEWKREFEKRVWTKREHGPKDDNRKERIDFSRDYARILYSSSFRRLQGKMQLFGMNELQFSRNRLTHSFEVAQISRSIAEQINEKLKADLIYTISDIYVLEAASLAHDIGNPPFGHHGEKVLNDLMQYEGGFEGNAQGLRVLRRLEKKYPTNKGLNLTNRTLASIVKYNVKSSFGVNKKCIYDEDFNYFERNGISKRMRTLDVQIIDLADEIAYCAHDLEDALAAKIFTIDEFIHELRIINGKNKLVLTQIKNLINKSKKLADKSDVYNTSEEYAFVFQKELTSQLVNTLIHDIGVIEVEESHRKKTGTKQKNELGFLEYGELASQIKKCTFKCINRSDDVVLYEQKGEIVIRELFEYLSDHKYNKNGKLLPPEYRVENGLDLRRSVCDYISGMMDSYAISKHREIKHLIDYRNSRLSK